MPYLSDGSEVEVVQAIETGVVIRRVLFSGDDSWLDEPVVVDRVYDAVPTVKIDARILELEAKEKSIRERIRTLEDNEREAKKRLEKFAKYPSLELLEDFLDGKITHYVEVPEYGDYRIIELKDAVEENGSRYHRPLRLLCLYGDQRETAYWRLSKYSDGSGSTSGSVAVYPCTSYGQATAKLQDLLCEHGTKSVASKSVRFYQLAKVVSAADRYSLAVPETWRDLVRDNATNQAKAAVADAEKKLAAANANLASKMAEVTA